MKIIDTFDSENNKNIFYYLYNNKEEDTLTWLTSDNFSIMDTEYYFGYSGEKKISRMFSKLLEYYDNNYETALSNLSKVILNKYGKNWDKLYDAIYAEYNPIENYDGYEDETISNDSTTKVKTDMTTQSDNKYFGFNSAGGKDNGSNNVHVTGSDDNNKSNTQGESSRTLHKHGNMGVTTSQQMIESEIDLRSYFKNFYNLIYNDIDSILASSLYD